MKTGNITTKGCMKIAKLSMALLVIMLVLPAMGQTFGADAETAKALGEAAEKSSALAYVLGFVTVASMSLAAYTIKTKDGLKDDIQDLTQSIRDQTNAYIQSSTIFDREVKDSLKEVKDSMNKMNSSVDSFSRKPCALDTDTLNNIIKGKASK